MRHFLIERSSKGVKLKGCSNEPVFSKCPPLFLPRSWSSSHFYSTLTSGTLAALVYQHSITPLALPCKLLLPEVSGSSVEQVADVGSPQNNSQLLAQGAGRCSQTTLSCSALE